MLKSQLTFMAAALVLSVASGAGASTVVIGGLAGECSTLAKAGRSDPESLDICSRALDSGPLSQHDRAGTYVNRGSMEMHNQDYAAAHKDFQAALAIMPAMGEAHVGEGAYLLTDEKFADAQAEIDRGLKLGSEEPEKGYYFRAMAEWGENDLKDAYYDFRKASDLKPGWDLPRRQIAKFHVEPAPASSPMP
jgi:tetratricopeptide (TPR) repeat protein